MKKIFYLTPELAELLRVRAFAERRSESSIVRDALSLYFKGGDGDKDKVQRK